MKKPYRPHASKDTRSHEKPRHYGASRDAAPPKDGKRPFRGKFSQNSAERSEQRFESRDGFKPKRSFSTSKGKDEGREERRDDRGERSFKPKQSFASSDERGKRDFRSKRDFGTRDREDKRDHFKPKRNRDDGKDNFRPRRSFEKSERQRPERKSEQRNEYRPEKFIDSNNVLIWGLHAVRAAWLNPKRRCHRLWLTEAGQTTFDATLKEAQANLLKRPDVKKADKQELDRLTPPSSVHQGIVLETSPLHEPSLHDVVAGDTPPDLIIALDQVTDPHNVGAILRSAAAFGAGAVILTERNAPSTTGVLAKTASGAVDHVPQIHVVNLARALDELQEAGYWRVGLAEEGDKEMAALDLSGRTVLVLGAEGDGLRQLTRKKCDELARLPTGGAIGSLNVSNAAAVALYEVRRQKKTFS